MTPDDPFDFIRPGDTLSGAATTSHDDDDDDHPICFAAGTLLRAPGGPVAVEDVREGDYLWARRKPRQRVFWTGSRTFVGKGNAAPVVIPKGALGNRRKLVVSQQHRIHVEGWGLDLLCGFPEALAPAVALVGRLGIHIEERDEVTYHHILFKQHELVESEGILTESFYPGRQALSTLDRDSRAEVLAMFPELGGRLASPVLRMYEAKQVAERMA